MFYECVIVIVTFVHLLSNIIMKNKWRSATLGSFVMFSTSLYGMLISKSKSADSGKLPFHIQSSVFYSDCIKCFTMFLILNFEQKCRIDIVCAQFCRDVRQLTIYELVITCTPSIIFAIQNNLVYYALQNLDIVTFQLVNNIKVVMTGIMSYFVLNKRLDAIQWYSLVLICLGLSVASLVCANDQGFGSNAVIGIATVFLSQSLGAVGLVLNEFVIKKVNADVRFETKNILLYLFGMICDMFLWKPLTFVTFDHQAWVVSFYSALLGLSIGYLIRYTDSITRNLVGAGSLIITTSISSIENFEIPNKAVIFSTLIVVLSMFQYFRVGMTHMQENQEENSALLTRK